MLRLRAKLRATFDMMAAAASGGRLVIGASERHSLSGVLSLDLFFVYHLFVYHPGNAPTLGLGAFPRTSRGRSEEAVETNPRYRLTSLDAGLGAQDCRLWFLLSELGLVQLRVEPARCQELIVVPALDNPPVADNKDDVRPSDGGQPMGYDYRGLAFH